MDPQLLEPVKDIGAPAVQALRDLVAGQQLLLVEALDLGIEGGVGLRAPLGLVGGQPILLTQPRYLLAAVLLSVAE